MKATTTTMKTMTNMNKDQSTQQIREYLGVSYTINEVERFIAELQEKLAKQAPYFNSRDLDKLELLKKAIDPASSL